MKKFNKKIGASLIIMSILSIVANYFDVLSTATTVISVILSAFVGFIVMMQTYHYQEHQEHNPAKFWFIFSVISGIVLVCMFYAVGLKLISNQIAQSLATGLFPLLIPAIGIFLGDVGRVVLKDEPSVI